MSVVDDARPAVEPAQLRRIVYGLSALGVPLGVLAMIGRDPFSAALAIAAPLPALGLALTAPAAFEERRRGGSRGFNPLIGGGVFGLTLAAAQSHLMTVELPIFAAAIGVAAAVTFATVAPGRERLESPIQFFAVLAVLGGIYGATAAALADVRFDASPGAVFATEVRGSHISNGKSTHYYLDLAPWGPGRTTSSVVVSRDAFEAARVGDPMCVTLHPGALGDPWVTFAGCQARQTAS